MQTNIVRRDGRRGTLLTVLKSGGRLHPRGGGQHPGRAAAGGQHAAARAQGRSARGPVGLRARGGLGGHPRGDHRGLPHRADDPPLPGELAQHPDHRGLDPALDPDLGDHAELPGGDHQHHDPGRPRPRGGHPGGRRHRHHREHRALSGGGPRAALRHLRRGGPDRGADPRLHALHLHRVPAHVLPERRRRVTSSCRWRRRWSSRCSPPTCSRARSCPPSPCTCCAPRRHHDAPDPEPVRAAAARVRARLRADARRPTGACSSGCSRGRPHSWPPSSRCACRAWLLVPWLGENFFPVSDNGQFILHLRAKTGTRIEETARLADLVEAAIRREIPPGRARQHHRQHRTALLDHQLHVQPLRLHRRGGRRRPGHPQDGAPAHRGSRAQPARAPAPGVSRRDLLLRARRHRDPDPQLRAARPDRRADRGQRHRGQPAGGQPSAGRPAARARPDRPARSSRTSTSRTSR